MLNYSINSKIIGFESITIDLLFVTVTLKYIFVLNQYKKKIGTLHIIAYNEPYRCNERKNRIIVSN